ARGRPAVPTTRGLSVPAAADRARTRQLRPRPGAALTDHRHERRPRDVAARHARLGAGRRPLCRPLRRLGRDHGADPVPRALAGCRPSPGRGGRRERAAGDAAAAGSRAAGRSASVSDQPLLLARGAGRRFGETVALEPVELELLPGEGLALVGPNGAGKSTLISLLAGALQPSDGRIERRKGVRVGWAPQRPAQYGRLSARENLELFAKLEGEADPEEAAARLLESFDLP